MTAIYAYYTTTAIGITTASKTENWSGGNNKKLGLKSPGFFLSLNFFLSLTIGSANTYTALVIFDALANGVGIFLQNLPHSGGVFFHDVKKLLSDAVYSFKIFPQLLMSCLLLLQLLLQCFILLPLLLKLPLPQLLVLLT